MKLNLECKDFLRNGYVNISSVPIPVSENKGINIIPGRYNNLDPIVPDNSIDEIIFNPPLNIMTPHDLVKSLSSWNKKLTRNGVIRIWFIDIRNVAKAIYDGSLETKGIHELVLGANNEYKMVLDLNIVQAGLSANQFKIDFATVIDTVISIEAVKV